MLIAQMTDIHIGFEPDAKPEELNRIRFRQTLARLLDQPNTPDMLVLSGDLTDRGDAESFDKITKELEACPFPVYPLVGNHDTREELLRAFPDCPSEDGFIHYAVEGDGLRVLMLDTFEDGRHGGAFCDDRKAWLSDQLNSHSNTPTLIFMHHPPVVSGIGWMDPAENEPWMLRLAAAMRGHEQVLAIHCGHLHRPIVTRFAGIPLGVTPSVAPLVAMDLREISPDKPDDRALITTEPSTYALHRWDGTNLVTHYEKVSDWDVLARYGPHLQPMIRDMFVERE
ncbi:MAG TPA: phosphodiesterase [Erythrobacter sp.]|nr:phosphodiesterase [Erythrobacter sp.]